VHGTREALKVDDGRSVTDMLVEEGGAFHVVRLGCEWIFKRHKLRQGKTIRCQMQFLVRPLGSSAPFLAFVLAALDCGAAVA